MRPFAGNSSSNSLPDRSLEALLEDSFSNFSSRAPSSLISYIIVVRSIILNSASSISIYAS